MYLFFFTNQSSAQLFAVIGRSPIDKLNYYLNNLYEEQKVDEKKGGIKKLSDKNYKEIISLIKDSKNESVNKDFFKVLVQKLIKDQNELNPPKFKSKEVYDIIRYLLIDKKLDLSQLDKKI